MSGSAAGEFARIHETYRPRVRAWAARLIGEADAEDVTQEVFLKVGRSLGTLSDPAKLGSWIHAITLNTARDFARRRSVRPEGRCSAPVSGPAEEDVLTRIPDVATRTPEGQAVRGEMVACYLDFVKRLPPAYYPVYVLSDLEHLSVPDIARRLSLSPGAVKIRLHRARARLLEELRRHCQPCSDERGELMGEPRGDGPPPRS